MLMPSLFRFVVVVMSIVVFVYGGLYVMAVVFEPQPREVRKPVPGVQVRT